MFFCGHTLKQIGASAARFRLHYYSSNHFSFPVMFAIVGLGTAVHGVMCAIVSKLGMPYLIFAAPVQYIARFIGQSKRSMFADTSFDFTRSVVLTAILIYIALIFLACCIGYAVGHRKELAAIAKKEAYTNTTPPEKTWSEADEKQVPFAYLTDAHDTKTDGQ